MRVPFEASDYEAEFLDVMEEFRRIMGNHHGHRGETTRREYTVELNYSFPQTSTDVKNMTNDVSVVLNLSHDKHGVFTKHHLQAEGDKPFQFKSLKEDIDALGARKSFKSAMQLWSSRYRPEGVNVFDEVRKALEMFSCTDVTIRQFRHALKFVGVYGRHTKFMVNVYTTKSGRLNTKMKRKNGIVSKVQNVVWDYPKPPPVILALVIDEVVEWIKAAEGGQLSLNEIEAGPNNGDRMESLVARLANLNL
jgi:hypothetical protein